MPSWLETYAPKRFSDLAVPEPVKNTLTSASLGGNPPHLLISGPAGVGKTAAWRLVARQVLGSGWESTSHVLQARDLKNESGAMAKFEQFLRPGGKKSSDTLAGRTSLDAFDRSIWGDDDISSPPPAGVETDLSEGGRAPISRLIVIEDADHLGSKRQPYLRRMMEREANTSRFIFTARAPSRLIDALRSRCQHIRIPSVDKSSIDSTLKQIATKESLSLAPGLLGDVIHVSDGNLRRAIFTLELLNLSGQTSVRESVHNLVSATTLQGGRLMVEQALRGNVVAWSWTSLRGRKTRVLDGAVGELSKLMDDFQLDADDVIVQIHRVLTASRLMLSPELRSEALHLLAECDAAVRRSSYPRIQLERFLHEISNAGLRHGLALA